jgi:hypothetical protein
MSTFRNGCDYRLRFEGEKVFLEYGCFGVLVNLVTGKSRLLMRWHEANPDGRIDDKVSKETIAELLKRAPCKECGGFIHATPPASR